MVGLSFVYIISEDGIKCLFLMFQYIFLFNVFITVTNHLFLYGDVLQKTSEFVAEMNGRLVNSTSKLSRKK